MFLGEDINVKIPSNKEARILMSIENGEKVLQSFWLEAEDNFTEINIPTTKEMNANVYLHAHLVQKA